MTTQLIYASSELALAAYATLVPGETRLQLVALEQGGTGMAPSQAQEFARRYPTIVAQFNDTSTSFSATVFAAADGQLHLAIRGTAETSDYVPTDLSIARYGVGFDQVVAMVNWWRRATASQTTQVTQLRMESYPPTLEPSTTGAVYV